MVPGLWEVLDEACLAFSWAPGCEKQPENKTITRKTKAGSGISVLSTEKQKEANKHGRKEKPLQKEL